MTIEEEAPQELPVCRDILEGLPCPNKIKWTVTETDGSLTYTCLLHKPNAIDDGLAVESFTLGAA